MPVLGLGAWQLVKEGFRIGEARVNGIADGFLRGFT
jgi:hypothetical protein